MSDSISRADAIKAVEDLPNAYNGWSDTYDKACIIGVIEELPSADAVDCTDFIEWLVDRVLDETIWEYNSVAYGEIICRKLEKLGILEVTEEPSYYIRPSADAVQGEWQPSSIKSDMWHCSVCGSPLMTDDINETHFCPNCGARMKGGAE